MGTSGVGSPSHVAGVLMEQLVGVKWQMISYRSAGLATQDLLAGITDIQLDTPAVSLTHVRSGDLKAYAAPAVFSTTTGCPSVGRMPCAMIRPSVSVEPPGASGTT